MTDKVKVIHPIEQAMTDAIMKVIGAVAAGAASGAVQSTAGAQGVVGGAAAEAGLSSQGASSDVQTKVDVSAAEVIESLNIHSLKDAALANKALVNSFSARTASNDKLYDITATALGLATLTATHHMGLVQQTSQDHRDLAHDRQWNVNETDLYATIAGSVAASVLAAMAKNTEGE